jgi:NADH-quinone oxidoreductase subunit F
VIEGILRDGGRQPITRRSIEVRDPPVAAFLGRQKHIATEHYGEIDPTDLDEYLQRDGFKALERCVKDLSPQEVIEETQNSGLRGRGGAGFPTGLKWARVCDADGDDKYIICNGDEGDPGAFMDRMLMESFPYRIIEGMAIAAHAVGAREGYFYIRAEYPLAVQRIRDALSKCEQRGFLGDDIFGTGTRLHLRIMQGAGAFVCGEETALLASIEGNRGNPRLRPPYPAKSGLWGKPTLVGNVETYACVPWIIRNGAGAFAALGTATSNGTKVFALAGKVKRGGLIEVPMGVTIHEIVSEIGGGVKDGGEFKAVQIGGPSGGCIPAAHAGTPVDYEALTGVGAIMGSGGLVVLDQSDCMVDIARYFLSFTQDQSCGRCTYCRVGTRRMLDVLNRLCAGEGKKDDLETLEQLAHVVNSGSLCGLGKTAPNPVLSTLRYFRDEYEAHLEGRCPAGKCKALITYSVTDACVGCTLCAQHCPVEAIAYRPYEKHEIDDDKCTRCDTCRAGCPEEAITVI